MIQTLKRKLNFFLETGFSDVNPNRQTGKKGKTLGINNQDLLSDYDTNTTNNNNYNNVSNNSPDIESGKIIQPPKEQLYTREWTWDDEIRFWVGTREFRTRVGTLLNPIASSQWLLSWEINMENIKIRSHAKVLDDVQQGNSETKPKKWDRFYDANPDIFQAVLNCLQNNTSFVPPHQTSPYVIEAQLLFWRLDWWDGRYSHPYCYPGFVLFLSSIWPFSILHSV